MTLFDFLRKIRSAGADISRLKIRMSDSTSGWDKGFKIHSLRGNRLSVDTVLHTGLLLQPGHSALKREVLAIRHIPMRFHKVTDINSTATLVVDLGKIV